MTYQTSIQLKSAIKKYFPNITSGGLNILDIGVGDGVFLNMCEKYHNNITGIDINRPKSKLIDKINMIYDDAANVFINGNEEVEKRLYDIVNISFCLCLIFTKNRKRTGNLICWDCSEKTISDFKCMASYLYKITNKNAIVLVRSHNTKYADQYSTTLIDAFVVNGFVLNLNQKNITHRFIKK